MPSFIDNVAIEVKSKSVKQNSKSLTKIVQKVFSWANQNAVKFDDEKSELIHFELSNSSLNNTIKLSNNTILKSKIDVKWLEIYMNRKLNFKKHVQNRITSTNGVLHSVNWLQNSKRDLKSNTRRQIYQTCITSISDYDAKIGYNAQKSQKSYINQLQKLQNSTIRKILRSFRIASIEALKIESNISSIEIRMHRKMQKYALRTMKMTKNHSIRLRISIFYSSKYQNEIFDENSIQ